ncbi:MAG TPA: MOSC N-terminal beta barrel domain-containing protein [Pseudonocardiaceae bacterium]|jgi:hypothetical protein|nr:MOSC N-terminal beta barrel domain-containing protein [Pseudonocardiaceae bacterium]
MVSPSIHELLYYPVKGCAGVSVPHAEVISTGLRNDRLFMVVDAADGAFLSQRTTPAMAVVRTAVTADGSVLTLSAPTAGELTVPVSPEGDRRAVSLFGKWFGSGVDQGEPAAEWFSTVLGRACRLVRTPPEHDRDGWGEFPGKVGFADAHAVLVASLSSLDGLNERIVKHGGKAVPMNRFRPNLVVSGWPEPHTEDRVRRMSVGTVELAYAVRCVRCAVPMVEQSTGRRSGPEPIRSLAEYRREPEFGNGVSFGMKAGVLRPGALAVSDAITVHAWEQRRAS